MQHISTFARPDGGGAWAYSFTQEWPFRGMRHQLSYTIPVLHDEADGTGLGDIVLNYRYQLVGRWRRRSPRRPSRYAAPAHRQTSAAAAAPAALGFQANLPAQHSRPLLRLALHANAGAHLDPHRPRTRWAPSAGTLNANLGGSAIWLLRPTFNLLFELLWLQHRERRGAGTRAPAGPRGSLNPGVRWAFNFPSGLQIVPGRRLHDRPGRQRRRGWPVPLPELRAPVPSLALP